MRRSAAASLSSADWRAGSQNMRTANAVLLTFGIVLFVDPAAAESPTAHRPVHTPRPTRPFSIFNALAPQAIVPLPAPVTEPGPNKPHGTDGLSRDPDDCVKQGCIDSGGG